MKSNQIKIIIIKHTLFYFLQIYNELPPCLLDALTLFLGNAGYVQVGYEPLIESEEDVGVAFSLKCVLAVNNRFFLMSDDEVQNIYELLANFDENPSMTSLGPFDARADLNDQLIVRKGQTEIEFPAAIFGAFMDLGPIISAYMFERRLLREHFEGILFEAFNEAAEKCHNDGPYISFAARSTNNKLIVEIACNFRSLFIQYCQNRRRF